MCSSDSIYLPLTTATTPTSAHVTNKVWLLCKQTYTLNHPQLHAIVHVHCSYDSGALGVEYGGAIGKIANFLVNKK